MPFYSCRSGSSHVVDKNSNVNDTEKTSGGESFFQRFVMRAKRNRASKSHSPNPSPATFYPQQRPGLLATVFGSQNFRIRRKSGDDGKQQQQHIALHEKHLEKSTSKADQLEVAPTHFETCDEFLAIDDIMEEMNPASPSAMITSSEIIASNDLKAKRDHSPGRYVLKTEVRVLMGPAETFPKSGEATQEEITLDVMLEPAVESAMQARRVTIFQPIVQDNPKTILDVQMKKQEELSRCSREMPEVEAEEKPLTVKLEHMQQQHTQEVISEPDLKASNDHGIQHLSTHGHDGNERTDFTMDTIISAQEETGKPTEAPTDATGGELKIEIPEEVKAVSPAESVDTKLSTPAVLAVPPIANPQSSGSTEASKKPTKLATPRASPRQISPTPKGKSPSPQPPGPKKAPTKAASGQDKTGVAAKTRTAASAPAAGQSTARSTLAAKPKSAARTPSPSPSPRAGAGADAPTAKKPTAPPATTRKQPTSAARTPSPSPRAGAPIAKKPTAPPATTRKQPAAAASTAGQQAPRKTPPRSTSATSKPTAASRNRLN